MSRNKRKNSGKHIRKNRQHSTIPHEAVSLSKLKSVRSQAVSLLDQVAYGHQSLNSLLPRAGEHVSDDDFALLQEMVYGSCRWYYYLQSVYQEFLNKPLNYKDNLTDCCLIVGAYQLIFMRTPVHAAINETVNAAEELKLIYHKGMINAILRRISEQVDSGTLPHDNATELSYPTWLKEKLTHNWPDHWQSILQEGNQRPPMTIRVNSSYCLTDANNDNQDNTDPRSRYLNALTQANIPAAPTPFSLLGITLEKPQSIDALPDFEKGASSVQDEAAQLCTQLMDLSPGLNVLDACAAPGGKSGALLERFPDISLTALDSDENRSQRIHENLERLQLDANVIVAPAENLDDWWNQSEFDRILLDAPCSATGVIRRHPDIKLLRQEGDIKALAEVQMNLLTQLWKTLKTGGKLVYATCSVLPQENSRIIERFLKQEPTAKLETIELDWGFDTGFGKQLFPTTNGHDGFFYSCLRKHTA